MKHAVVKAEEEWNAGANLVESEDAGVEAVVEVGGEVGNFVGEIDELSFKGRAEIEEVFSQFGMLGGDVVAGMLDDAFADTEREVEAAPGGVSLFKPGDDAQGVEIVVEAEAVGLERVIEGFFTGVAEGWMANVVGEGQSFGQFRIEAEGRGGGAGDLGDLEGVGEATAEMVSGGIAGEAREYLGFAGESAECTGMQDTGTVASKGRSIGVRRLRVCASRQISGSFDGDCHGQVGGLIVICVHF
jgi:hypothetical protein